MESFSIILPSPPFHPQKKKKKNPTENMQHIPRELIIVLFQQPLDFINKYPD